MADPRPSTEGDSPNGRLSARELTLAARQTVDELTGYQAEAVSGFQWDGEIWLVSVDICELERIPNTTDVMATYVVQLDDRGLLLGYKRDRRYQRGHAEESERRPVRRRRLLIPTQRLVAVASAGP
jgi:hypothetical protein